TTGRSWAARIAGGRSSAHYSEWRRRLRLGSCELPSRKRQRGGLAEVSNRHPLPRQRLAQLADECQGARIFPVNAERAHPPLTHQPLPLPHRLLRVFHERVRLRARHERTVRQVAPIREALRDKLAPPCT